MYKGTHHFIQCTEYLRYTHGEVVDAENPWAGMKDNPAVTNENWLCKSHETFFPIRKVDTEAFSDNVKFYVRPLECRLKETLFRDIQFWGPEEIFDENCVDFEKGDEKPQIRVHGNALFNITNFAQFENIQFTAVDNLAVINDTSSNKEVYEDMIQRAPFKLCDFETEATSYLEDPKLKKLQGNDISYVC